VTKALAIGNKIEKNRKKSLLIKTKERVILCVRNALKYVGSSMGTSGDPTDYF